MRALLAIVALALAGGAARAGGPLVVTTDGVPVGWDTTSPIPYHTDLGTLGVLSNASATAMVDRLFGTWAGLPTVTIRFARTGTTAVNVDVTNFGPYLGPYGGATAPRHENVVVFDADGSIFDTLFGVGTGVVGFAGPAFLSNGTTTVPIDDPVPPGAAIVEGLAFLNGKWIDGIDDPANRNGEMSQPRFEAVIVHELGHFSGLDHTQIHGLYGPPSSDSFQLTTPIETMFPFAVDETQATPGRDDVVALSTLYPTPAFAASTGRITGRVLTADGVPLSGVDVIARNVADDADAISYVSGATLVRPGEYTLAGLTPGARYTVEVQEIDAFHSGGSRVGPFSPPMLVPGPPEFWSGAAESADPVVDDPNARTTITAAAGATTAGVDVVLNRQRFSVTNVPLEAGSQPNAIAIADFDRDGIPDFVVSQLGFNPGNVIRFFRGVGGGGFAPPVLVASFPGNAFLVAGQLNPAIDDFLDLAVVSISLNQVRVYLGDGTGHFGAPTTVLQAPTGGAVVRGLALGDVDGDAFPDLVTVVEQPDASGIVYALRGDGAGGFSVVQTPLAAGSGYPRGGLRIRPLAPGGAAAVVGIASTGGVAFGPPALGVLLGDGHGGFVPAPVSLAAITTGVGLSALAVGDFDENGTLDVALSDIGPVGGPSNWTRSFVDVLLGDGAGGFRFFTRYAVPESSQDDIIAADLDGDGHLDLASTGAWYAPGRPGAKVSLAFGDGTGGIRETAAVWGLAEFPSQLAAADLDGDGLTDLLVNDGQSSAFGLAPAPAYSVLRHPGGPSPSTTIPPTTTSAPPPTTTSTMSTSTTTTSTSTSTTTTTRAPITLSFTSTADAYVTNDSPKSSFGTKAVMIVDASPLAIGYLRFTVTGVTGAVARAILRLTVDSGSGSDSASGGRVHAISNHTWQEKTLTAKTRPAVDGPVLATAAAVKVKQVVDFDVTAAVISNGTYDFAIDTASSNDVRYRTREASTGKPTLILTVR